MILTIALVLLALAVPASAAFLPAVRVDQENRPGHACYHADICLGPALGGTQPVYVAFEDDSVPFLVENSDIAFQRSTDAGRTWLPGDVLIRQGNRFACYPDMQVAPDGTIHLVYTDRIDGSRGHIHAVRSTDSGNTWSAPIQVDDNSSRVAIGWARLALDSAGRLFCVWTDQRGQYLRVFADVSTDRGATWGTDKRVDDDTVSFNCYPPDAFVQPGTNHYLAVAVAPVRGPNGIVLHSHFYKSNDMGRTFSPGFQLDTFSGYSQQPHVVADENHVITDYSGNGYVNQCVTLARTWHARGDTWGRQVMVTELDTTHSSFTNGAKLAIDPSSTVHTGLMIADRQTTVWGIYYAFSTDYGCTWSQREEVSDIPTVQQWDPTIATDAVGNAYLAWQDMRNTKAEIWFSTNNSVAIREPESAEPAASRRARPTIFTARARINVWPEGRPGQQVPILDHSGRLVTRLVANLDGTASWDGTDISGRRCPAGVYFCRRARPHEDLRLLLVR